MKTPRVLFALIAAATAVAVAQPGPGRMRGQGPEAGRMHQNMMQMLNLTPEQQKQMAGFRDAFQKKMITTRSKVDLARVDLRQLVAADKPDRAAIDSKLKEISDLQYQQKVDLVDHLLDVRGILTPEQLKIWKQHAGQMMMGGGQGMRMMRQHMRGGMGMSGGDPAPPPTGSDD